MVKINVNNDDETGVNSRGCPKASGLGIVSLVSLYKG